MHPAAEDASTGFSMPWVASPQQLQRAGAGKASPDGGRRMGMAAWSTDSFTVFGEGQPELQWPQDVEAAGAMRARVVGARCRPHTLSVHGGQR